MSVTHPFVSNKTDGSDDTVVRPSNWNAPHVVDDSGKGFLIQGNASTGELESSAKNYQEGNAPTDSLTTAAGAKEDLVLSSGLPGGTLIASIREYTGNGIPVIVQAAIVSGSLNVTIGNAGLVSLDDAITINFVIFTSD